MLIRTRHCCGADFNGNDADAIRAATASMNPVTPSASTAYPSLVLAA
jgi:hypothetical protein